MIDWFIYLLLWLDQQKPINNPVSKSDRANATETTATTNDFLLIRPQFFLVVTTTMHAQSLDSPSHNATNDSRLLLRPQRGWKKLSPRGFRAWQAHREYTPPFLNLLVHSPILNLLWSDNISCTLFRNSQLPKVSLEAWILIVSTHPRVEGTKTLTLPMSCSSSNSQLWIVPFCVCSLLNLVVLNF